MAVNTLRPNGMSFLSYLTKKQNSGNDNGLICLETRLSVMTPPYILTLLLTNHAFNIYYISNIAILYYYYYYCKNGAHNYFI